MSHTPHEIAAEFPDMAERIHQLKISNAHFARIAETYHDLNRQIHRMETNIEPASDIVIENLKKSRLKLKDEISELLQVS